MPVFGSPVARARACLILAAVLWSLGSVFMRLLREPLGLGLDDTLTLAAPDRLLPRALRRPHHAGARPPTAMSGSAR